MSFFDSPAPPNFLQYLERLDTFLARRSRKSAGEGVDGEDIEEELRRDPDVRRLIEAIAFSSRAAAGQASKKVQELVSSLATGPFASFDRPMASSLMVAAKLTGLRLSPVDIPAGATFEVEDTHDRRAFYTTTYPLRILPIVLERVETRPAAGGCYAVRLLFRARVPLDLSHESINLQVQALGDTGASLNLYFLLRRHLSGAELFSEHEASIHAQGERCTLAFAEPVAEETRENAAGPLGDLRLALSQPASMCRFQVRIPAVEARSEVFELRLMLDPAWPSEEMFSLRNFMLHTVLLENRFQAVASPIFCDGRTDEYEVVALQPADAVLHHIVGVYEATKAGPKMIPPAFLATSNKWWAQLPADRDDEPSHPRIRLRLPRAVIEPRVVSVQAQWLQPETCAAMRGKLTMRPYDRVLDGVTWQAIGTPTSPARSPIESSPEATLQLMAWRGQKLLPMPGLRLLLRLLGLHAAHEFAAVIDALTEISGEEYLDPSSGEARLRVLVKCANIDEEKVGSLCALLLVVAHAIRIWSAVPVDYEVRGATVPLLTALPSRGRAAAYETQAQYGGRAP